MFQMVVKCRRFAVSCVIAICAQSTAAADAQTRSPHAYPSRPVRLLLGLPAGGGADVIARTVTPALAERLGQPIVVDNRPGANGVLAPKIAAAAPADGYTLLFRASFVAELVESLNGRPGYDLIGAFAPVSLVAKLANVLLVSPAMPAKDVAGFIAYARANPGKLNYGSSGVGSSAHLSMELLKKMAGVQLTHVPYRGAAQFGAALLSGEIQASFANIPGQLQNIRSGKVRALAVTSMQRSSQLPEMPTLHEAGFPGFEVTVWFGVVAPARTPDAILARLNDEIARAVAEPEVNARLRKLGAEPAAGSRAALAKFQREEAARLAPIIREAGIKPE